MSVSVLITTISAVRPCTELFTTRSDWTVPVWHQSVLLPPEHDANVSGMISGRVEVCVISCRGREGAREGVKEGERERKREIV